MSAFRRSRLVAIAGIALLVGLSVGCSRGGDEAGASEPITAVLEIITTNIQSAISGDDFEEAEAGQELTVGDRVKTDRTGFAELAYHDGSWQRIENNATLTIDALTDTDDGASVRTAVDVGRTWNRVRSLAEPEDGYELETPVATASVRGTVFATECSSSEICEFRVYEGTVVITTLDGEEIVMVAPSVLEVRAGVEPGDPEIIAPDVLRRDPWAEKNLELDRERIAALGEGDGGDGETAAPTADGRPTQAQLRSATLQGSYDADRQGIRSNYLSDHPNHVAAGSGASRSYVVSTECEDEVCEPAVSVEGSAPDRLDFVDGSYLQTERLSIDCVDPATGQQLASEAARLEVTARWRPNAAEYVDGEWIATELRGLVSYRTVVLDATAFDDPRCSWPTSDGQPPDQLVSTSAERR